VHGAAQEGNARVLELLLAAGGNPNGREPSNMTPLLLATSGSSAECVRLLLSAGANVAVSATHRREQPVHYAAYGGHTKVSLRCR